MELPLDQILLGDCLDVLKTLPDESIDSVCSDPPYGLGNKDPSPEDILAYVGGASSLGPLKKGRRHCLNSVVRDAAVTNAERGDAESTEDGVTFRVSLALNGVVPSGMIEFNGEADVGEHEVDDEGTIRQLHDVLVGEVDALTHEGCGDGTLRLREREGFSGCIQACSCFSQLGETLFRVVVWLGYDSFGESQTAASVLTARTAEARAVLTLDVARLTGELRAADSTDEGHAGLLLAASEDVRAAPGASRLLTALQILLAGKVSPQADGTLTFVVTVARVLLRRLHEPRVPQKDFMNRSWEIPSVAVWREVYRVLKPGGHVLSFAGTRTFDLISVGLRMAGFESRDTIGRNYPILQWIQGQGMPKSHNVSVAIDKKLVKKREVVGTRRGRGGENLNRLSRPGMNDADDAKGMGAYGVGATQVDVEVPITAPASDEAKQWSGWGSSLKPAWEPILVFRKPLEGTLANNVLKYGTGGLNIDACRVRHASKEDFEAHKAGVEAIREKGGSRDKSWKNSSDLSGANEVTSAGRWPSNTLLEHSSRCRKVGTKRVRGSHAASAKGQPVPDKKYSAPARVVYGSFEYQQTTSHVGPDGLEETQTWECADGCPVATLDAQSGDRPSTLTGRADPSASHEHPGTEMNSNSTFLGERTHLSKVYADAGGASRFFTQFEGEEWECVEGCPVKEMDQQSGELHARGNTNPQKADKDRFTWGRVTPEAEPNPGDAGGASRFSTQFEGANADADEARNGRWPTNAVWVHAQGCEQVGVKKVKGITGGTKPPVRKRGIYDDAGGYNAQGAEQTAVQGYSEADGNETVEAWRCVEGCPVKALQGQGVAMGSHTAGNKGETNHVSSKGYGGAFKPMTNNPDYHADEGGVDRFFSQFEAEGGVPFKYVAKANRKEAGCGEFEVQHVTLKPLSLLRWLVKLVTRKGGTVLDMYAGSGTTCHAAVLEGMHFIGIERDPDNHAEAVRRLEIVLRREQERTDEEETLAFMMGRDG